LIPCPFILLTHFPITDTFYQLAFSISLISWVCSLFLLLFRGTVVSLLRRVIPRGKKIDDLLGAVSGTQLYYLLASSLAFHATTIIVHYYFAKALGIDIAFSAYFIIIPSVLILTSLPISVNGIGVREGSFILAFNFFLISPETSLAIALLSFSLNMFLGIAGGVWFLLDRMSLVTKSE